MKKLIQAQKDKVLAELCQKIVARDWSEHLVSIATDEIKEYVGDEDKELKDLHDTYLQDLKNVETNKYHIESDVFAYNTLENIEQELKDLLCIK